MRRSSNRAIAVLTLAMALVASLVGPATAEPDGPRTSVPGLVVTESTRGFDATLDALTAAIEQSPAGLATVIDHAAAAAGAGVDLEPTSVVYFGDPALGTPLMQADQVTGIDLPQKLLVWQDGDEVLVAFNSVEYLQARHDVEGVGTLPMIAGALESFAAAAAGVDAEDVGDVSGERADRGLRRIERRPGLVTVHSSRSFDATVTAVRSLADATGSEVVFELDHAANAERVDLELRPTTLLVLAEPRLDAAFVQRRRTTGIDLPSKVLVHADADGDVLVTFNDPFFLLRRHRVLSPRHLRGPLDRALDVTGSKAMQLDRIGPDLLGSIVDRDTLPSGQR